MITCPELFKNIFIRCVKLLKAWTFKEFKPCHQISEWDRWLPATKTSINDTDRNLTNCSRSWCTPRNKLCPYTSCGGSLLQPEGQRRLPGTEGDAGSPCRGDPCICRHPMSEHGVDHARDSNHNNRLSPNTPWVTLCCARHMPYPTQSSQRLCVVDTSIPTLERRR